MLLLRVEVLTHRGRRRSRRARDGGIRRKAHAEYALVYRMRVLWRWTRRRAPAASRLIDRRPRGRGAKRRCVADARRAPARRDDRAARRARADARRHRSVRGRLRPWIVHRAANRHRHHSRRRVRSSSSGRAGVGTRGARSRRIGERPAGRRRRRLDRRAPERCVQRRCTASPPQSRSRQIAWWRSRDRAVGTPAETLARWRPDLTGRSPVILGDGAVLYADIIAAEAGSGRPAARVLQPTPRLAGTIALIALGLAKIGTAVEAAGVQPLYVRRPDAEIARDAAPPQRTRRT